MSRRTPTKFAAGFIPNCGRLARLTAALWIAVHFPLAVRADDNRADAGVAAGAPATKDDGAAANSDQRPATSKHIESLIRELGSPRFTARRAAANELRQIGPEAFDLLHAASDDADPEVAASARYLLRQITVRWVESDDPASTRRLLRDYGEQSDKSRLRRVDELAKLPNGEGVAGLCRVARFDRSPLLSRVAALAIIRPDEVKSPTTPNDPEIIDREIGTSKRAAAQWLRQYRAQLRDPAASIAPWQKLIDEEAKRLDKNSDDTTSDIVLGLLWNLADVHRQLGNRPALMETVDRMVRLDADAAEHTAVDLLSWFVEHKSWEVIDEFLVKYDDQLSHSKRPMYVAALARSREGKDDLAEQLAEKASRLDPQTQLESFVIARDLETRGQFDWAVREYRRGIDNQEVASHQAMLVRIYLANLLQDHEQHQQAADVIEPLVSAIRKDANTGQLYTEIRLGHLQREEFALPESDQLAARLHFYRACQYRVEHDAGREREELDSAIRLDETDADVLIAMYRVTDADDKWRETTRRRIAELTRRFQQQIDQSPNDHEPYNQWAWLISNTEGDYQKAVRYSQRSIELLTASDGPSASASYLDTLGRCYYAVGDFENAVKSEREAIDKLSHLQVMHRQLALFEKALAEKQAASNLTQ